MLVIERPFDALLVAPEPRTLVRDLDDRLAVGLPYEAAPWVGFRVPHAWRAQVQVHHPLPRLLRYQPAGDDRPHRRRHAHRSQCAPAARRAASSEGHCWRRVGQGRTTAPSDAGAGCRRLSRVAPPAAARRSRDGVQDLQLRPLVPHPRRRRAAHLRGARQVLSALGPSKSATESVQRSGIKMAGRRRDVTVGVHKPQVHIGFCECWAMPRPSCLCKLWTGISPPAPPPAFASC